MDYELQALSLKVMRTDSNTLDTNFEPLSPSFEVAPLKSWTNTEDSALLDLVTKLKPKKWTRIAKTLNDLVHDGQGIKNAKLCRERWFNHVNPSLSKGNWSTEEDIFILENKLKYGNVWSKIARTLTNRNENIVKNRYNAIVKAFKKEQGSNDIQEMLEYKREQLDRETPKIIPVPVPCFPSQLPNGLQLAWGVCKKRKVEGADSKVSSGSDSENSARPHLPGERDSPELPGSKQDDKYQIGIFVPVPNPEHLATIGQYFGLNAAQSAPITKLPNVFNDEYNL